jgi:serine/threonine protein kinase
MEHNSRSISFNKLWLRLVQRWRCNLLFFAHMQIPLLLIVNTACASLSFRKRGVQLSKMPALEPCERLVGQVLNGKYHIDKQIGQGYQSIMYSASYSGEMLAVKCYKSMNGFEQTLARNEISILKALDNPNIISVVDSFKENNVYYMVTELFDGDLEQFQRYVNRYQVKGIFTKILDSVVYMHQKGVYHHDLKLDNILVKSFGRADMKLQISDFGLATTAVPNSAREDVREDITGLCDILLLLLGKSPVAKNEKHIEAYIASLGLSPQTSAILVKAYANTKVQFTAAEFKAMFSKVLL